LRKAIARIADADLEAMGKAAYSFAVNVLTWERTAQAVRDLYAALDGGGPARSELTDPSRKVSRR
jgi:glycosyltransferase involved in cell wall biosynthesis